MAESGSTPRVRPFWSGVISFGLVSVPVALFPANRSKAYHLRMVDKDGTLLRREYFCSKENRILDREQIIRGKKVDEDRFVTVTDEELQELEPEKSREIDLKRFVPEEDIDPMLFLRAYFLVPDSDTNKAYRLLTRIMEQEKRAGIAQFVMRDHEYLVAIFARNGILQAETLRYHDEIRSADRIDLPEVDVASKADVKRMQKIMAELQRKELDTDDLEDPKSAKLQERVQKKLEEGEDVIVSQQTEEEAPSSDNVVDLMQILKQRLEQKPEEDSLGELTRDELYGRAQSLDISGRSRMNKQELIEAIRNH